MKWSKKKNCEVPCLHVFFHTVIESWTYPKGTSFYYLKILHGFPSDYRELWTRMKELRRICTQEFEHLSEEEQRIIESVSFHSFFLPYSVTVSARRYNVTCKFRRSPWSRCIVFHFSQQVSCYTRWAFNRPSVWSDSERLNSRSVIWPRKRYRRKLWVHLHIA